VQTLLNRCRRAAATGLSCVVVTAALASASTLRAQQDGLVAFPSIYRVQFENDWVRVVRIRVPVNARVGEHTHPAGLMIHVYLNDADPITFTHTASYGGSITRPAVVARSYRVGHTREETHGVVNTGRGLTDYLRIEFKTMGMDSRKQRIPAPPLGVATTSSVEVENAQYRATRITVAARDSFVIRPGSNEAALLVAVTDDISVDGAPPLTLGQERFVDSGRRVVVRPKGFAPVQLLRIDFLTRPAAAPK
jgi:hypothetical protein